MLQIELQEEESWMKDSATHSIQFRCQSQKTAPALLDLLNFFSENEAIKQRQSSSRELESRKRNIQYTLRKSVLRDLTITSSSRLNIIRSGAFLSLQTVKRPSEIYWMDPDHRNLLEMNNNLNHLKIFFFNVIFPEIPSTSYFCLIELYSPTLDRPLQNAK